MRKHVKILQFHGFLKAGRRRSRRVGVGRGCSTKLTNLIPTNLPSASMHSSPRLSLTKIRALTGVSMQAIKSSLGHFRGLYRIKCTCRFCPEKELTQEEVDYLCEEHTLTLWRTLSLVQRTRIFSIRFPGRQISVDKLRRVYRLNGIKMRALKFKKSLTEK